MVIQQDCLNKPGLKMDPWAIHSNQFPPVYIHIYIDTYHIYIPYIYYKYLLYIIYIIYILYILHVYLCCGFSFLPSLIPSFFPSFLLSFHMKEGKKEGKKEGRNEGMKEVRKVIQQDHLHRSGLQMTLKVN